MNIGDFKLSVHEILELVNKQIHLTNSEMRYFSQFDKADWVAKISNMLAAELVNKTNEMLLKA